MSVLVSFHAVGDFSGRVCKDEECRIPPPHNFGPQMQEKDCLLLMRQMCYTLPRDCSVSYNAHNLIAAVIFLLLLFYFTPTGIRTQ
jgi:hypothetical protein